MLQLVVNSLLSSRLIAVFCVASVAFCLAGCGGNNETSAELVPEESDTEAASNARPNSLTGLDSSSKPPGNSSPTAVAKASHSRNVPAAPGNVDTHVETANFSGEPNVLNLSKSELEFQKQVEALGIAAANLENEKDFTAAVEKRQTLLDLISKKFGANAWQTTNARLSLQQTHNYSQMTEQQHAQAIAISQHQNRALEQAGRNDFEAAIKSLGLAASETAAFWGDKHHLTARAKYRQAEFYRAINSFPQAVSLYKSALAIEDAVIGRNHPRTIEVLAALATTAMSRGQLEEAESWQQQALDAAKNAYGSDAVEYSHVLREFAAVKTALRQLDEAIQLYTKVYQIRLDQLGSPNPLVSESSYELGRAYYQAEQFDPAIAQFKQTIPLMNQTHGGANNVTLTVRNNLAMAHLGKGDSEAAEEILLNLLETRRTLVGEKHVDYARAQHHLAILYASQGDMPKAEPFVLNAMKIYQRKLGANHPLMAEVVQTYATMLRHSGQLVKAEQLEETLREMADAARGVQGPLR